MVVELYFCFFFQYLFFEAYYKISSTDQANNEASLWINQKPIKIELREPTTRTKRKVEIYKT